MLGLPQMQQGCDPSYPNAIESSKSHVGFVWLKVVRNLGRFVKLVIRTSERMLHVFEKLMHVFWKRWCTFFSGNAIHSSKWGPNSPKSDALSFCLPPVAPQKVMRGFSLECHTEEQCRNKWTCQPVDRWCLSEAVPCKPAVLNWLSKLCVEQMFAKNIKKVKIVTPFSLPLSGPVTSLKGEVNVM